MPSAPTCNAAIYPTAWSSTRSGSGCWEIGEAVKALPPELLGTQPGIPWRQIARMRDHLAHRYFDTAHAILQATVDDDLPELERAVGALAKILPGEDQPDKDAASQDAPSE
jgi:hypothetical protein